MQKDNLEQFISQNRTSFDKAAPSLKNWDAIEKKLDKKEAKRIPLWRFIRTTAAVFALLGIGAAMGVYFSGSSNTVATTFGTISPEHAEMEEYFEAEIEKRTKQLASFNKDEFVYDDLVQLEDLLKDLEKELQETTKANNEHIIEAMIKNYQTRIDLLERVLKRVDKKETTKERPGKSI